MLAAMSASYTHWDPVRHYDAICYSLLQGTWVKTEKLMSVEGGAVFLSQEFTHWAGPWWHTPLIPALGRQRQADFWVWGQPGLQSEFQDSQGYTEKPCLEKTKTKQKRKFRDSLGFQTSLGYLARLDLERTNKRTNKQTQRSLLCRPLCMDQLQVH